MAVREGYGAGSAGERSGDDEAPAFTGPLDQVLGSGPVFRSKLRGYDPMEVDTYVSWAESELRTVRRQVDDLLARFGACSAELEISRRLLADAPRGRVVFPVSERVEEMLQLAAEEAAAITDAGHREAEHLVAEARSEADARLRKAHEIKETAVRAADELRDHARKQSAEAQALLDRAGAEAAEIVRAAAAERDALAADAARERDRLAAAAADERRRLDDDAARQREQAAAAAAARLAELTDQVEELRRQRDQARQSLRGLSSRIGEALQAVAATVPDALVGTDEATGAVEPNVAVEGREYDPALVGAGEQRDAGDGVVVLRRPAAVS
ncbi:DivIVA domain-containing protein [Blastococcus sp. SYSU D01042]